MYHFAAPALIGSESNMKTWDKIQKYPKDTTRNMFVIALCVFINVVDMCQIGFRM